MTHPDRWRLHPTAQDDLAAIWRKGAETGAPDRADRNADSLFAPSDLLANFPEIARERPELSPSVRIHPIVMHLVIYRAADRGIEVTRRLKRDKPDVLAVPDVPNIRPHG